MGITEIDSAFAAMISQRGIHTTLNLSSGAVRQYRAALKAGTGISTDKKLELLKLSGWKESEKEFTRKDVIAILKFWAGTNAAARGQGPEYVLEKWEQRMDF